MVKNKYKAYFLGYDKEIKFKLVVKSQQKFRQIP